MLTQLECIGEEVLFARTLFETANQIGDCNIKFLRVNNGRVQNQGTDALTNHLGLSRGHAEQHLDIHAVFNAALLRQCPGKGKVKEVVSGNTDSNIPNAIGSQCIVQYSLVVGIGSSL